MHYVAGLLTVRTVYEAPCPTNNLTCSEAVIVMLIIMTMVMMMMVMMSACACFSELSLASEAMILSLT